MTACTAMASSVADEGGAVGQHGQEVAAHEGADLAGLGDEHAHAACFPVTARKARSIGGRSSRQLTISAPAAVSAAIAAPSEAPGASVEQGVAGIAVGRRLQRASSPSAASSAASRRRSCAGRARGRGGRRRPCAASAATEPAKQTVPRSSTVTRVGEAVQLLDPLRGPERPPVPAAPRAAREVADLLRRRPGRGRAWPRRRAARRLVDQGAREREPLLHPVRVRVDRPLARRRPGRRPRAARRRARARAARRRRPCRRAKKARFSRPESRR